MTSTSGWPGPGQDPYLVGQQLQAEAQGPAEWPQLPVQKAMLLTEPDAIVTAHGSGSLSHLSSRPASWAMAPVGIVLGRYDVSLGGVLILLLIGRNQTHSAAGTKGGQAR